MIRTVTAPNGTLHVGDVLVVRDVQNRVSWHYTLTTVSHDDKSDEAVATVRAYQQDAN